MLHKHRSNRFEQYPLDRRVLFSVFVLMCLATGCLLRQIPFLRQDLPLRAARQTVRAMGSYTYQWPRPALTVDTVIVAKPADGAPSKLLLIQRKHPPCKGQWALPGGFVNEGEPLYEAAARELQEETSVQPKDVQLFQTGSYGDPGRDPRGWTVTVAYAAVVPSIELGVKAAVGGHSPLHNLYQQHLAKHNICAQLICCVSEGALSGTNAMRRFWFGGSMLRGGAQISRWQCTYPPSPLPPPPPLLLLLLGLYQGLLQTHSFMFCDFHPCHVRWPCRMMLQMPPGSQSHPCRSLRLITSRSSGRPLRSCCNARKCNRQVEWQISCQRVWELFKGHGRHLRNRLRFAYEIK